ncbi:hypothetical protein LCGC14_0355070 [marine sediment metagenome]|uniref:Uncharacterized protein n=1 Tax=marine sediment metagenome TaxID=412755 RepID=A0A0F9TSL0_9ZZZZ
MDDDEDEPYAGLDIDAPEDNPNPTAAYPVDIECWSGCDDPDCPYTH